MAKLRINFLLALLLPFADASAQFIDHFDSPDHASRWITATGDGQAKAYFTQQDGIGIFDVDATSDKLNIWWAIARRRITGLDMKKLSTPEYELRVEARIRVSHAPRRVNLHVNHQRTTDFHSHLMEFDIPDTTNWHIISMTTRNFETHPGDSINAHLAMMDWGLAKYRVEFDYFRVDVIELGKAKPDLGNPMPYHAPLADVSEFTQHVDAIQDATIDTQFADQNFNGWYSLGPSQERISTMVVSSTQLILMRWDVSKFKESKISGAGLLELTPYSVQRSRDFNKDFGMVRICEILAGDPAWNETTVTFDRFTQGEALEEIINTQMIVDDSITWNKEGKVLFTISQPVLQRLITGKTKGLAIKPLGAMTGVFLSRESESAPRLHFDIVE